MNTPIFLSALSGALIFVVAAFLPYWVSKRASQRIARVIYVVACLPLIAVGCSILGVMISMIPYAAGGSPIGASLVDKFLLQAFGLPWIAVIFGAYVGRKRPPPESRNRSLPTAKDEAQTPAIPVAPLVVNTEQPKENENPITAGYVANKAGMALAIGFGALFGAVLVVQIILWAVT